jgi:hypothetical protein
MRNAECGVRNGEWRIPDWRAGAVPRALLAGWLGLAALAPARAQDEPLWQGDPISEELESVYVKGLAYLVKTQESGGTWGARDSGQQAGVVGMAVLAMLAHGDDPNTGPYSEAIRKGIDFLVKSANAQNGYIGPSMYNHGFATLALAEAYGNVNDPRIGPALEKAVKLILTSQAANSYGAWRYSPESRDADTTVSGAQVVALLAARNAGIAVPEKAIEKALQFYRQTQGGDGGFGYTSADGTSPPRAAIGTLVFALAKRKNSQEFKAGFRHLQQIDFTEAGHVYYYLYYAAQAYFHGDMESWRKWKETNRKNLAASQGSDGSWTGSEGTIFCTSAALLSLALEYRYLPIYER